MPNKITERDEQGRIVKKELSSKSASEIASRSHQKRNSEAGNRLLASEGFNADNPAPEHLAVLAEYAVGGKSGAVGALRDFRRLTGSAAGEDMPAAAMVHPGDICPTCKQYVMAGLEVTGEDQGAIAEYISQMRGGNGEPGEGAPNLGWED